MSSFLIFFFPENNWPRGLCFDFILRHPPRNFAKRIHRYWQQLCQFCLKSWMFGTVENLMGTWKELVKFLKCTWLNSQSAIHEIDICNVICNWIFGAVGTTVITLDETTFYMPSGYSTFYINIYFDLLMQYFDLWDLAILRLDQPPLI
jgi:hypothetical protein